MCAEKKCFRTNTEGLCHFYLLTTIIQQSFIIIMTFVFVLSLARSSFHFLGPVCVYGTHIPKRNKNLFEYGWPSLFKHNIPPCSAAGLNIEYYNNHHHYA